MYQTLNYKVTPETIPDASTLDVDDINWILTHPLPSGIGHTPQPKQPKLSGTPVRCTTAQKVPLDVQEQLHETIGNFMTGKSLKMIKDNKLPLDNIAHELF